MGSSLNSEITSAWESAQSAAERYGDFVTALMSGIEDEIDTINTQITSLETQISNLGSGSSGSNGISATNSSGTSTSLVVGTTDSNSSGASTNTASAGMTDLENVNRIVLEMMELSDQWRFADTDKKKELADDAMDKSQKLQKYGVKAERNNAGEWYITEDKLNPENVGELLYLCYPKYHTGGIVGSSTSKQDEVMAVLQKGEAVLDGERQKALYRIIDFTTTLSEKLGDIMKNAPFINSLGGIQSGLAGTQSAVVTQNKNIQPNIQIVENISCVPEDSVDAHQRISRTVMNEIARQVRQI